jgi:hypothetical protein
VDEFREIWFQNAADPPAFAARSVAAKERSGEDNLQELSEPHNENPSQTETIEAEAESDFLQGLVADRELEDEINRHLTNEEFQQVLAEAENETGPTKDPLEDEGNLSDLDDDDEVSGAIINEASEHFILKAKLWMESNRDYLREQRGTLVSHNN